MSETTSRKVAELFEQALEQDTGQRASFLERECQARPDLLAEVVALLESDAEAGDTGFWGASAIEAEAALSARETDVAGQTVGPYKLLRVIGSGGMGTVCLGVRDDSEYRKCVAIKLIKRGMDTNLVIQRFRTERQILANLEHPNIARLLDGGTTAEGLPYLVMEYIEGQPIHEYATQHKLSTAQRLALFRTVCSAVEYAHQNLVVHRDLKPSNILVTSDGTPKLLDFGIARILAPNDPPGASDATVAGLRFMTPEYASPEQVRVDPITTVSDVYSLGVLLYRLLTGCQPYRLKSQRPDELATAICTQEPVKPSTLAGAGAVRGEWRKLRGRLGNDLDNIVLMAMRKDPVRRYASVGQFSDDIRRHLEGLPVTAHRDTVGYRFGKFVRRNAKFVAAACLVFLSLVGGIVGTLQQAHVARMERARAERRFNEVRKLANSFLFEFHDSIEKIPGTLAARQLILKRALEYLDSLAQEAGGDRALQSELAEAYDRVGTLTWDVQARVVAHRKALAIDQTLVAAEPSNRKYAEQLGDAYSQIGAALKDVGDNASALASYRGFVHVMEALSKAEPANVKYRNELADSYVTVGLVLERVGRVDEALQYQHKALAIQESMLQSNPANVETRRVVMTISLMIAHALTDNGDYPAALAETRASQTVTLDLNAIDPLNAVYRRDLWIVYMRMGGLMMKQGKPAESLPYYRKALAAIARLSAADPGDKGHRRGLAFTDGALADALQELKLATEAKDHYLKGIAISQTLLKDDPHKPETQDDLGRMDAHLASLLSVSGDFAKAEELLANSRELLAEAVSHDPNDIATRRDQADMYTRWAELKTRLAERETSASEKRGRWQEARDFHAQSMNVWVALRNQNVLWRADSDKPAQAMRSVAALCEAAMAKVRTSPLDK